MNTMKKKKQYSILALLVISSGVCLSSNTFATPAQKLTRSIHYIGETYGGGKVFYIYDGGRHGLIAAAADQIDSTGIEWYNGIDRFTGTTGDGVGAGAMNTAMIISTQIGDNQAGNFAAKVCADYSVTAADGVTYGDWYLPSKKELDLLYQQKNVLGGFSIAFYWSSTELDIDLSGAWVSNFYDGTQGVTLKSNGPNIRVRCSRAF
jgi:hypothetical protein